MQTEPLLGFRWWQVPRGTTELLSWIHQVPWRLDWNRAEHDLAFGEHKVEERAGVPGILCGCGYYGWYRLDRCHRGRNDYGQHNDGGNMVVAGAFMAAGRIVHHQGSNGFRCECARPIALVRNEDSADAARVLAEEEIERFGLPVLASRHFEEWCREWGELRT